jgi:ATP-dependent helicase/nuclease subunit A
MKTAPKTRPPDQAARDRIGRDLGTTFLVEAGAGSGKTTSLVERMIALLATGRTSIETLAAVTFTRKAAAELRGRFQVALERARLAEKDPAVRERLEAALTGLERAFIGTIHAFCTRLLRERPVEAGIDPEFRELEDHEDRILLERSWDAYQARARLENEAAVRGLDEAGLVPADLETAFAAIAGFPDVEPVAGRPDPPAYGPVREALETLVDLAAKLVPRERPDKGRDGLQNLFVRLFRRRRNIGFTDGPRLMESVELFDKTLEFKPSRWPVKGDGQRLLEAAEAFQEQVARPALRTWREFRHSRALDFLKPAVGFYAEKRRAASRLNFQDQLMLTARLLRDNPEVRRYFRKRFHPILVDEFQDTDPIQAEILFLLAGTSETETDWTRLSPAPGSLFLVGDPKQSIYRFRRADVDIYNLVKDRIEASGGETLTLSANFRSVGAIADWVDPLFDPERGGAFPAAADAYQAGFMPLRTVRGPGRGPLAGVRKITVPAVPYHRKEDIAAYDAARVAGFIAWALAGRLRLDDGAGGLRPAAPGDFLVLFRYKDRMSRYARRLEEIGVPFEISGSDAFAENAEIGEVMNLLRALDDPDDPVATVAALRGMFFGLSDQDLLDRRAAGGGFGYLGPARGGAAGPPRIRAAFAALRAWRDLATRVPPSVALETIVQDSGLLAHLVTAEMGGSRAGNVLKLIEVLRGRESEEMTSFAAAVAFLAEWVGVLPVEEMSLTPGRRNAVRLMNLHKAKGLEAPVVWLANPAGVGGFEPDRHVRRTGRTPLGHFRFTRPFGRRTRTVSQPAGWEESAAEELKYEAAEEDRLMYVAATRARDLLVVSGYAGDLKDRKAWGLLETGLAAVQELPECPAPPAPPSVPKPPRRRTAVKPDEVTKGREELRRRMGRASVASTLQETVTSLAKKAGESPEWAKGGLGLWGSEVHVMLKTLAAAWPGPAAPDGVAAAGREEVERLARDVLAAAGRNPVDGGALAAHVAGIVGSTFWARAMRAGQKLFEVPFSVRVGPGEAEYARLLAAVGPVPAAAGRPVMPAEGAPVFLSGAIDLVFKEEGGWVIADYKTDRLPAALAGAGPEDREKALQVLVAHYRPQVELYTRFWARMTGDAVKESGLYFTALDRWIRIPVSG